MAQATSLLCTNAHREGAGARWPDRAPARPCSGPAGRRRGAAGSGAGCGRSCPRPQQQAEHGGRGARHGEAAGRRQAGRRPRRPVRARVGAVGHGWAWRRARGGTVRGAHRLGEGGADTGQRGGALGTGAHRGMVGSRQRGVEEGDGDDARRGGRPAMERSGEDELRARQACGEGRRCPGWLVGEEERTGFVPPIRSGSGRRGRASGVGVVREGGSERVGLGFRASRGK